MGQLAEGPLSLSGWAARVPVRPPGPGGAGLPRPGPAGRGGPAARWRCWPTRTASRCPPPWPPGSPAPWPATWPGTGSAGAGAPPARLRARPGRSVPAAPGRVPPAADAGPCSSAAAPPGPASCPGAGRHARPALPDLRLLDGGGCHRLGRGPRPRRLRRPAPAGHAHHLTGRVGIANRRCGGGRPGCSLGPAAPARCREPGHRRLPRPALTRQRRQVEVAQPLEVGRELGLAPVLVATGSGCLQQRLGLLQVAGQGVRPHPARGRSGRRAGLRGTAPGRGSASRWRCSGALRGSNR